MSSIPLSASVDSTRLSSAIRPERNGATDPLQPNYSKDASEISDRSRKDRRFTRSLSQKIGNDLNQSTRSLTHTADRTAAYVQVCHIHRHANTIQMHNGFVSFRGANFDRDMEGQRAKNSRNSIADDHDSVREATMDLIRVGFIVEAFQHVDDFSNLTAATAHPA